MEKFKTLFLFIVFVMKTFVLTSKRQCQHNCEDLSTITIKTNQRVAETSSQSGLRVVHRNCTQGHARDVTTYTNRLCDTGSNQRFQLVPKCSRTLQPVGSNSHTMPTRYTLKGNSKTLIYASTKCLRQLNHYIHERRNLNPGQATGDDFSTFVQQTWKLCCPESTPIKLFAALWGFYRDPNSKKVFK